MTSAPDRLQRETGQAGGVGSLHQVEREIGSAALLGTDGRDVRAGGQPADVDHRDTAADGQHDDSVIADRRLRRRDRLADDRELLAHTGRERCAIRRRARVHLDPLKLPGRGDSAAITASRIHPTASPASIPVASFESVTTSTPGIEAFIRPAGRSGNTGCITRVAFGRDGGAWAG
jgi:hypothetical protein